MARCLLGTLHAGSTAQFRREFVLGAAGRTGRVVDWYPLVRSHSRRNHEAAIAANVIDVAGSAKQRSGGLRGLAVTGIRRGMRKLQNNSRHFNLSLTVPGATMTRLAKGKDRRRGLGVG